MRHVSQPGVPPAVASGDHSQSAGNGDGGVTAVISTGEGSPVEEGLASMRWRMEYAIGMVGRHATLARLRKTHRLPLTEAAYNGHHEVLQVWQPHNSSASGGGGNLW